MLKQEEKTEERLTNQILVNKDDYQDEFKFDICRSIEELNNSHAHIKFKRKFI